MCRFVSVISTKEENINSYFDFLKTQAKKGKRAPHPDGFGVWIKNDAQEFLYKSTIPVWISNIKLPPGKVALLHARKRGKTGAPVSLLNSHPFIYKDAVFMHNGILYVNRHPKALGYTDTESFFLTLMSMGVEKGIKYIADNYNFKSLNFVMYKDNAIYAFRLVTELQNYFTIYLKEYPEKIIISTEKNDNYWTEIRNGELIKISPNLQIEKVRIFPNKCH